jgi:glycosyltransferase involved in cell wall biosynthesis
MGIQHFWKAIRVFFMIPREGYKPGAFGQPGYYGLRLVCSPEEDEDSECRDTRDGEDGDPGQVGAGRHGDDSCDLDQSGYLYSGQGTRDDEPGDECETPLRLAHVGPSLVRAGIEQWLKGLARFLDPGRVRLVECVVTMPENLDWSVAAELPVPVTLGGEEAVRKVSRECDVLMFWGPPEIARWLADCRPRLGLFVAHGEGRFTRDYLRACEPVIDHVVAVSRRVKERVCEGLPTTVITNGIDTAHLSRSLPRSEARGQFGFLPSDFVLGYVGRFSPEKRPETVIHAASRLPHHFKVLLVGWGHLEHRLLDLANRLIPGRFAIARGESCLGDYYQAMDALCMSSSEEGYSLVVLEAMMCGLPVIATPVGCVPELIVDRVSGLVVTGEAESFRDAALLLEKHPSWAAGLAAEGRKEADRVGHARQMARKYESLIQELWQAKFGEGRRAVSP